MLRPRVELLEGALGREPALEIAVAQALLGEIAAGRSASTLRIYRPPATVAFGRRDVFLTGFPRAARAAADHGFTPVIRAAGGRAAAYDEGSLVLDELIAAADSISAIRERFALESARQARALRGLGVDARVGEVPGEYCAGEYSVNARGAKKLVGAAQRAVPGAWLLSSVVVVVGSDRLRAVLEDVYAALELAWDPGTVGAIGEEAPGADLAQVRRALLAGYAERFELIPATLSATVLAAGERRLASHLVSIAT